VELTETISGLTEGALYRWRARVLYAPYSVTEAGITPTVHPLGPAAGRFNRDLAASGGAGWTPIHNS
jgi:hypothetical protein